MSAIFKIIKVLIVEPNKEPYVATISDDFKSMQKVVGGIIQAIYPFKEKVILVCNDEGKLKGLPFNRNIKYSGITDAIAGTFFISGDDGEDFISLSDEYIEKFSAQFKI